MFIRNVVQKGWFAILDVYEEVFAAINEMLKGRKS
jgi:hypothetical protein